ncbi:MAG TPA: 2-phosphosulfolactate phosphatase [Bacteroidota bacterium]|nr:2-phosphosulfolactate phosphatase [Bacteroidota bacterium]
MDTNGSKRVVIDFLPDSVERYREDFAIIAIDVIRATTTAITAAAMKQRCFPVSTVDAALSMAEKLQNPLLAGEIGGNMPYGFHVNNSPAEIARRIDRSRPIVLLSSSGTRLMCDAQSSRYGNYIASFRNYGAVANYVAIHHANVAVIGAGTRGEFREEDQMCCAWITEHLLERGFAPVNDQTVEISKRWSGAPADACLGGKSAEYLKRSGQEDDLYFILSHVNDVDEVFKLMYHEIMAISPVNGVPIPIDDPRTARDKQEISL